MSDPGVASAECRKPPMGWRAMYMRLAEKHIRTCRAYARAMSALKYSDPEAWREAIEIRNGLHDE